MAKERLFIGTYSGLAADGVDAVLAAVCGRGPRMKVRQLHYHHHPMPVDVRKRIVKLCSGARQDSIDLAELDRDTGIIFADAAHTLMRQNRISHEAIVAIGMSAQTIAMVPPDKNKPLGAAMVLGAPALTAQRTGVPVVSGFLTGDLAGGGHGGPVAAWGDWVLFKDRRLSRVIVHLGGLTSMTFVGTDAIWADVMAFDVGPGTAVLDSLTERLYGLPYDTDGAIAARGSVNSQLLNELLSNPYFRKKPPKTSPLAEWGDAYLWRISQMAKKRHCDQHDLLATVTELIAKNVANAVSMMTERPHQVILSGGGAKNIHLAGRIRGMLSPSSTLTCEKLGFATQAKQGVCYAMLAASRMDGIPVSWTAKAEDSRLLGALTLP